MKHFLTLHWCRVLRLASLEAKPHFLEGLYTILQESHVDIVALIPYPYALIELRRTRSGAHASFVHYAVIRSKIVKPKNTFIFYIMTVFTLPFTGCNTKLVISPRRHKTSRLITVMFDRVSIIISQGLPATITVPLIDKPFIKLTIILVLNTISGTF